MKTEIVDNNAVTCFCSVIPPYILASIADHPDAPEEARTHARNSLLHTETFIQQRQAFISQRAQTSPFPSGVVPGNMLGHSELVVSQSTAADATPKRLDRSVYSSNSSQFVNILLLRSEGSQPSNDKAADECYDYFGATFNFFFDIFSRNSLDDKGLSIIGSVHYGPNLNNAYWTGTQMVFGDGDGIFFNRLTASVDVVGHELTHGVTQYTANLFYQGESGALNESISDVFGSMVKQYLLKQTAAQADWLIGTGIFTSRVQGVALRSMRAPGTAYNDALVGKDRQMAHYSEVLANPLPNSDDNGGVHVYSGIPNRAFYLAAIALGGNSWDRAGKIWYATLRDARLKTTASFREFAGLTTENAETMCGTDVKAMVEKAWIDVGVVPVPQKPLLTGTWSGFRSGAPLSCSFSDSGNMIQGRGTLVRGSTIGFTITNGSSDGSTVKFTLQFDAPNTSIQVYTGQLSGDTISGTWEDSLRQAYLNAGFPDSFDLHGEFSLKRTVSL